MTSTAIRARTDAGAGCVSRSIEADGNTDMTANGKRLKARDTILDQAEKLLRASPDGNFGMRDLAREAGMSLRTLVTHFGSKSGIYAGLLSRFLDEFYREFLARRTGEDPIENIFLMCDIGIEGVTRDAEYYRAIASGVTAEGDKKEMRHLFFQTELLWRLALSSGEFRRADVAGLSYDLLPSMLSAVFRGVQTLWTNEGIADDTIVKVTRQSIAGVILGFVEEDERARILARIRD